MRREAGDLTRGVVRRERESGAGRRLGLMEGGMQGTIVRTTARDGTPLEGMLYVPPETHTADTAVIHAHGTWGNFYGNPFIDTFGDLYPQLGYAFLTGNNRGHDGGSITERFDDCVQDLDAWLQFAKDRGCHRVVLQGHSLGALKAIHYLRKPGPGKEGVRGLILLSPFDIIAFYAHGDDRMRQKWLARVRELARTDPDAIVPKDIWDMWLLSAAAYLDLVDEGSPADLFPTRRGSLAGSPIARLELPAFVAIGGEDFASLPSPRECFRQVQELGRLRAVFVEGGPHNFAGQEHVLGGEIEDWLKELPL
jgi:pimeloyl-ACP methyl ester carboxylesterase